MSIANLTQQGSAVVMASVTGAFTAQIEASDGQTLSIVVTDEAGNSSTPALVVVPVRPALQSLSVSPASLTLNRSQTSQQLVVTGAFSDGSQQTALDRS